MFKLSSIKKLGHKPPAVRSAEEAQARVDEIRSWTQGPINKPLSWLVQLFIAGSVYFFMHITQRVRLVDRKKMDHYRPPYMFVSNHVTMIDDFLFGGLLYFRYAFMGVKYFPWHAPEEKNFFLGPIITWMLKKAQCVPLTRGHGVFQPGMTRLKQLLMDKGVVMIYPEGTRTRSGDIGKGKVGIGRLAYQTKVKVIPAYHEGAQDILPIGTYSPKIGKKFSMIIGDPIDMSDLYELKESRETYQAIADRMIVAIRDLRQNMHDRGFGLKPIPEATEE